MYFSVYSAQKYMSQFFDQKIIVEIFKKNPPCKYASFVEVYFGF